MARPAATRRAGGDEGARLDRAFELVMQLMAIPGKSGEEAEVAEFIVEQLRRAGARPEDIARDKAHLRSPLVGQTGNLVFKLPGSRREPRRMLSAHLDTVPLCIGSQPVRRGKFVRSAAPTALGADDRAGAAVILVTALEILERQLPHPPLTFCWFVQEEIGLQGARLVSKHLLARPRLAYNWDGGSPFKLTVGATGGYRMRIVVEGLASHAGGAPEWGVSAVSIAALAIADLQRGGWHGAIQRDGHYGTSNFGVIRGGNATNVVTDHVEILAEARSHNPKFRERIVREVERAFRRAAREVQNAAGARGQVLVEGRLDYESFLLDADEPCVRAAEDAVRSIGGTPQRVVANGGVDANWTHRHGIPTVTLGCGQLRQHMLDEALDIDQFHAACRIALQLATGPAP